MAHCDTLISCALETFLLTYLLVVSGENKVSAGASSRDGQDAQHTSSQQQQQGDTIETFQQSCLSSGKFDFNVIHLSEVLVESYTNSVLICNQQHRTSSRLPASLPRNLAT